MRGTAQVVHEVGKLGLRFIPSSPKIKNTYSFNSVHNKSITLMNRAFATKGLKMNTIPRLIRVSEPEPAFLTGAEKITINKIKIVIFQNF